MADRRGPQTGAFFNAHSGILTVKISGNLVGTLTLTSTTSTSAKSLQGLIPHLDDEKVY